LRTPLKTGYSFVCFRRIKPGVSRLTSCSVLESETRFLLHDRKHLLITTLSYNVKF
jgi:hypothetical protein